MLVLILNRFWLFQLLDFEAASVNWDIWDTSKHALTVGTYPDGDYQATDDYRVAIQYCCRQDGFIGNGINLPIGKIEEIISYFFLNIIFSLLVPDSFPFYIRCVIL